MPVVLRIADSSSMSESQVQKMNAELASLKSELQALKEAEPVRVPAL